MARLLGNVKESKYDLDLSTEEAHMSLTNKLIKNHSE